MGNILHWLIKLFRRKKQSYGIITPRASLITQATGEKLKRGQWTRRNEAYPIGTPWWKYKQEDKPSVEVNLQDETKNSPLDQSDFLYRSK